MQRRRLFVFLSAFALVAGCRTYEEKPLLPFEILEEVGASRSLPQRGEDEGFVQAVQWLGRHSPRLKRVRAEYEQALSLAGIDTPFPNPEIAFGPLAGAHLGPGASHRIQPMIEFGFTLPLSGRLSLEDDVNRALADEALLRLVVEHRRAYLELRRRFAEWVLSQRRMDVQVAILKSTQKTVDLTDRLVKAGVATALDRGLMELEAAAREAAVARAESERLEAEEGLSRLIGVDGERIRGLEASNLPAMTTPFPPLNEARAVMVANNPDLALLRARYEVAERALRLEIRKQYPDLQIGASFEGDPGETKKVWGLGIGIALPLFDRNQQGIASAEQERDKVRALYEASLNESLAALEGLYARRVPAGENLRLLEEVALPRSEENVKVALQSIQAGAIDSLKYLEVERTMRSLLIEINDAEQEARRIASDVEQVMGVPIQPFPAESLDDYPLIPGDGDRESTQPLDEDEEQ